MRLALFCFGALVKSNLDGLQAKGHRVSWLCGLLEMSPTLRHPCFCLRHGSITSTSTKAFVFGTYYFGKSHNLRKWKVRKGNAPNNLWDWFNKFLRILHMGSISSKKHGMGISEDCNSVKGIPPTHPPTRPSLGPANIPMPTPAGWRPDWLAGSRWCWRQIL